MVQNELKFDSIPRRSMAKLLTENQYRNIWKSYRRSNNGHKTTHVSCTPMQTPVKDTSAFCPWRSVHRQLMNPNPQRSPCTHTIVLITLAPLICQNECCANILERFVIFNQLWGCWASWHTRLTCCNYKLPSHFTALFLSTYLGKSAEIICNTETESTQRLPNAPLSWHSTTVVSQLQRTSTSQTDARSSSIVVAVKCSKSNMLP